MADTESTCTSVDDRTEDLVSPTRDALVDGIVGLLKPCLDQLDDRVRATRVSQSELHQQLEGLAAELARVQEQTRCPLQLDAYIKKLQNAKRRVVVVNNILQNTQDRLNKLHTQVNKENARRRALLETTSPSSTTPSTSLHAP
ncbi:SNARE-associated protein Snapin-like [Homarus americanus]|uniref:Biogenesis of lysosome-related organelles complex 1 subunit 7 n=1 Tax=Homarus americanus TaxID=6706 RepID=A0A8J5JLV0_HOMAM|nr:SNARE-associated protein Snapin-like [Homarus americanus]KAG7160737.1 SNARE-associated protein Snapin-like [Homarus americanus]